MDEREARIANYMQRFPQPTRDDAEQLVDRDLSGSSEGTPAATGSGALGEPLELTITEQSLTPTELESVPFLPPPSTEQRLGALTAMGLSAEQAQSIVSASLDPSHDAILAADELDPGEQQRRSVERSAADVGSRSDEVLPTEQFDDLVAHSTGTENTARNAQLESPSEFPPVAPPPASPPTFDSVVGHPSGPSLKESMPPRDARPQQEAREAARDFAYDTEQIPLPQVAPAPAPAEGAAASEAEAALGADAVGTGLGVFGGMAAASALGSGMQALQANFSNAPGSISSYTPGGGGGGGGSSPDLMALIAAVQKSAGNRSRV